MNFSLATIQDAKAISDLVNSAYRGDSSRNGWTTEADLLGGQRTDPASLQEIISSPQQFFLLLKEGNQLMASVNLEKKSKDICYFGMFAVKPTLQNCGIGKKMLEESERFAKEKLFCSRMEMTVITVRRELIDWYVRRGYTLTSEIRPFPKHDQRFGILLTDHLEMVVLIKNL